jgi:hypothetical protein
MAAIYYADSEGYSKIGDIGVIIINNILERRHLNILAYISSVVYFVDGKTGFSRDDKVLETLRSDFLLS